MMGAETFAAGIASTAAPSMGKWVFIGAFALLLVWLILMPRRLIGQEGSVPPWWRNVRVWAIVVNVVQILIYIVFA